MKTAIAVIMLCASTSLAEVNGVNESQSNEAPGSTDHMDHTMDHVKPPQPLKEKQQSWNDLSDDVKEKIRLQRRTIESMSNMDNWQSPAHQPRHKVRPVSHLPDQGCAGIVCAQGSICQLTKKGRGKCFKHCETTCGHTIHHGWVGQDDGNNYCNRCKCRDGNFICKHEIECPETHPCEDTCSAHAVEKQCQVGFCHAPDSCTCIQENIVVCAKQPCKKGAKKCGYGYDCVDNYCGGCHFQCKEMDCSAGVPEKWSMEKQEYCCETKGVGCTYENCDVLQQLQEGEDYQQYHDRRVWCCAHREVGCPQFCYADSHCREGEECRSLIRKGGGCTDQLYCFPKVPAGYPCGGWSLPCYVNNCKDDLVCATPQKKDDRGVCKAPCNENNPCGPNMKCNKKMFCVHKKTCDDLNCSPYQCKVSEANIPQCLTKCVFRRDGFASDDCIDGTYCVPHDIHCERYAKRCEGFCGTLDDLNDVVLPRTTEEQRKQKAAK